MRKIKSFILLLLFITLVLTGCTEDGEEATKEVEKETEGNGSKLTFDSNITGEITFWTWNEDTHDEIIEEFNKTYPDILVTKVVLPPGELHDKLQTTLAAGTGAPDVSMIDIAEISRYSTGDLLVDLLQSPYEAGRYEDDTSKYNWERWKSIDGKKLLAMPWVLEPGIFFYRADIYEQVGLPSEPEELGEYIKDPDNFLAAAQTLSANDIYIMEWFDSPIIMGGDSVGYFDSDLNWLRNTEELVEKLDLVKRGIQLDWAPHVGVFSDEGKQLLKQGKIASIPMGSWGVRNIKEAVPEQTGKWRATNMPLDLNLALGGAGYVIPEQSENKEAAWAFTEWVNRSAEAWKIFTENNIQSGWNSITSLPWYQEREVEYLGGQQAYKLYASLGDLIPVRRYTPLDGKAWPIFLDAIYDSLDNNIDSKTTLSQLEEDIDRQLGSEVEELRGQIHN